MTLSAIPVHLSIAVCLSSWVIQAIDKRRFAFLWCRQDTVKVGKCRLAWETVCRLKELGGLGIVGLRRSGIALRLHWLWFEQTEPDKAWVGLHSKLEKAVLAAFHSATESVRGAGESTLFWVDPSMDGKCIRQMRRHFTRRSPGASIQERWPERCRIAGHEMSLGLSRSR